MAFPCSLPHSSLVRRHGFWIRTRRDRAAAFCRTSMRTVSDRRHFHGLVRDAALVEWLRRSAAAVARRRHGSKRHELPQLPEVSAVARLRSHDHRPDADAAGFFAGPRAFALAIARDLWPRAALFLP